MSQLHDLQYAFQAYLFNNSPEIKDRIVNIDNVSAITRLEIYADAYRLRLLECLRLSYPVMHLYMGNALFEELGEAYIKQHSSPYRSIRWYGDTLASFIKNHADYEEFPYLYELALFEWHLTIAFDAENSDSVSLETMNSILPEIWESICFKMHPSIQRLTLSWNMVSIWQAITFEEDVPDPMMNDVPVHWICWQKNFDCSFYSLSAEDAWALDIAMQGATFGDICEGLLLRVGEDLAASHAASLLKGWIVAGFIVEVVIPND